MRDLKRHASSAKRLKSDLDVQTDLNNKLESSINKLREENSLMDLRFSNLKKRLDTENIKMVEEVKNLKERNSNLMLNLRMQMTSTTKIDNARQKMSNRVKDLMKANQVLVDQNQEHIITIETLKEQLEGKSPSGYESPGYMHSDKTKGTIGERDYSQPMKREELKGNLELNILNLFRRQEGL